MVNMIIGEIANFVAYIFALTVLVMPLRALSIIVSVVLAHFLLKEKLMKMGIYGCIPCIVGSTLIVLHAPNEHSLSSVKEIWELATQPALFFFDTTLAIAVALVLVLYCEPHTMHGHPPMHHPKSHVLDFFLVLHHLMLNIQFL